MIKKRTHYKTDLAYYQVSEGIKKFITKNTVIVCIGTDKCIGDCLGPLVGTLLKDNLLPLPVYGTISNPVHALNLNECLSVVRDKHPNSIIIAIDACLGESKSIGEIHTRDYAIHPGKGVGKSLPDVGDASIVGIIDSINNSNFFPSYSIRLSLVLDMAKVISRGIVHAYNTNINV